MAVTQKTLDELAKLAADVETLTSAQARDLTKAYATAWDEVSQALQSSLDDLLASSKTGTLSRAEVARHVRLRKALDHIVGRLEDLAQEAGLRISSDLTDAVAIAGKQETKLIQSMLPEEAAAVEPWANVNRRTVDAIVTRTTKQIESRLRKLPAQQAQVMKNELIRGIVVGASPKETARRIMKQTQGRFEGGAARATRIARTETLDAMRAGARSVDLLNKDVLKGWRWTAQLDSRTCMACVGMHGRTFNTEVPGPEGHPNCRCARVPVTRSWADLGFKGIKEPPDLFQDGQKWFDKLPQAKQEEILGKHNLAAYKGGSFPMTQWAVRKENPNWRPSYVPSR